MTRRDDELDDMSNQPGAMSAPAAGEQDEVARFLVELRTLSSASAPPPSAEVAALIAGTRPVRRTRVYRRVVVRSGLIAAALLAALVGAAANHSLPQPAQRVVTNFVNDLSPFDIAPNPAPVTHTPSPTHSPSPQPTRHHRSTRPAVEPGDDNTGPGAGSSSSPAGTDDSTGSDGAGDVTGTGGSDDRSGPTGTQDGATEAPRVGEHESGDD